MVYSVTCDVGVYEVMARQMVTGLSVGKLPWGPTKLHISTIIELFLTCFFVRVARPDYPWPTG